MKFAFVIIETDESRRAITEDRARRRASIESWMAEQAGRGVLLGGEAFETEAISPVTVRRTREGQTSITEGLSAAGQETLGGGDP